MNLIKSKKILSVQKDSCLHTRIGQNISAVVTIALIAAMTVAINFFHFPFHLHGIEIERFELGLIAILLLIRKTSIRNLILAVVFATLIDQLQHGHNLISIPFEITFNIMFLLLFNFLMKVGSYQKKWTKISVFFGCLICTIMIKAIYFGAIVYIFIPEINLFDFSNTEDKLFWNNYLVLGIYTVLITIKFSIILGVSTYSLARIS